ncbi:hypothetical protein [Hoyosella altamirensis]|uniref:Uncharacterized protein n=1 Tax=Hoyosella altamirensis TaxID=616997 RepID=A0A839RH75_9ACTN|nr:hypothetical protein [Hoyosella altamirensis]MBB3036082.1 hypothetical protein [Hoyosella altamirensis]
MRGVADAARAARLPLGDPADLARIDYIILGVLCVDGFVLGLISVFYLPSYLGGVPFPFSVFLAAVGNILLVEAARRLGFRRSLAALPVVGWVIAVLLAFAGGPGGDIVVPAADARGLFLVVGGLVPVGFWLFRDVVQRDPSQASSERKL